MSINKWLIENLFFKKTRREYIKDLEDANISLWDKNKLYKQTNDNLIKRIENQRKELELCKNKLVLYKNKIELLLETHGEKTKRKM